MDFRSGGRINRTGDVMSNDEHAVVLFYSTSHAIKAQRLLKNESITCAMVPVPRHLSSECGACVRITRSSKNHAASILNEKQMQFEGPVDI
jgi:hypothetical protein